MSPIRSLLACLLFCLAGCCGPKIEDYAGRTPTLDIRQYMNGDLEAWGTFVSRGGNAEPRFYVAIHAGWQGSDGTMEEHFIYTDGRKQKRIWHLHMLDDHHFTATAGDVIGTGQGTQYGNAVTMRYTLRLTAKGKSHDVAMNDWLYLVDDTHLVNHTEMSKFGFKVGDLVIAFRKIDDEE